MKTTVAIWAFAVLISHVASTQSLLAESSDRPNIVKQRSDAYDQWIATMADSITGGPNRSDATSLPSDAGPDHSAQTTRPSERDLKRQRIRTENRARREAVKNSENKR